MPGELTTWIEGAIAVLLTIGLLFVVGMYFKLWLHTWKRSRKLTDCLKATCERLQLTNLRPLRLRHL